MALSFWSKKYFCSVSISKFGFNIRKTIMKMNLKLIREANTDVLLLLKKTIHQEPKKPLFSPVFVF